MSQVTQVTTLIVAGLLLGGCASRGEPRCDQIREYQSAGSIAPVTVPADLASPQRPGRLIIPEVPSPPPDAPLPGCLDRPPDFIVTR